jgi:polyisoprenoid-binding protein YceI
VSDDGAVRRVDDGPMKGRAGDGNGGERRGTTGRRAAGAGSPFAIPRLALVLVALAAAAVIGGYLAYDQFLRGDQVAPLGLSSPAATVESPSVPTAGAASSPSSPPQPSASSALAGSWSVSEGSVAGYRVREKLARLPAESDAVGRTSAITGEATLVSAADSVRLSAATFEVDLTTLQSDDGRRDRRLREIGLESDRFPRATFTLREPVAVPAAGVRGQAVPVSLRGDLTLHGVTKSVEIPAQTRLNGGRIEVVGSLTFPFADFAIEPPNIAGFVSVEDEGTLEFLVVLART